MSTGVEGVGTELVAGRYRIVKPLGAGGMATVYRVYDERLEVFRALKVLSPEMTERDSLRKRFEAEARTMAKLHHRNIVTVLDFGWEAGRPYIVMELVPGGSLVDRVEKYGVLPARMATHVGIGLLDALQVAHEQGVIHRDVKPHNLLISADGVPKLTDFGIAQITGGSNMTKTSSVMGTLAYMAPEQRISAKHIDERADLYAAGATVYTILTGREPYDLYNPDLETELFEAIPDALAQVLRKATRYKADERYPSARAFSAALRACVDALPEDDLGAYPLAVPQEVAATLVPSGTGRSSGTFSIDDERPAGTSATRHGFLATQAVTGAATAVEVNAVSKPAPSLPRGGTLLVGVLVAVGLVAGGYFAARPSAVETTPPAEAPPQGMTPAAAGNGSAPTVEPAPPAVPATPVAPTPAVASAAPAPAAVVARPSVSSERAGAAAPAARPAVAVVPSATNTPAAVPAAEPVAASAAAVPVVAASLASPGPSAVKDVAASSVVVAVRPKVTAADFPAQAAALNVSQGRCAVSFVVDATGVPTQAVVRDCTAGFEATFSAWAKRHRFVPPAGVNGPFRFEMDLTMRAPK